MQVGGTAEPPGPGASTGPSPELTLRPAARHWRSTLREARQRVKRDRVTVSAGSLAYHWFLAFFPAVIAGLGTLTLVHVSAGTLQHLTHGITKALPSGASGVVAAAVRAATARRSGSTAAVVVGIVVALWSASSAMAVLQQTLDVAYEVPGDRAFFARRIRGLGLMVLTVGLGGVAAILVVFGQPIGAAIAGRIPVGASVFRVAWTVFRWVAAFFLVSFLFAAYYHFGPNRRAPRWRWISPGSVLASTVFLAASLAFSYYISTFGDYGKTYGSFAGVVIFILWLFLTGLAVLLGGEVNAVIERQAALARGRAADSAPPRTGEGGAERAPATVPPAEPAPATASDGGPSGVPERDTAGDTESSRAEQ